MAHRNRKKWNLYADEDVESDITSKLRERGFKVTHVKDVELGGREDDFQFQVAIKRGCVFLTRDRGFWTKRYSPLKCSSGLIYIAHRISIDDAVDYVESFRDIADDIYAEFLFRRMKFSLNNEGFAVWMHP